MYPSSLVSVVLSPTWIDPIRARALTGTLCLAGALSMGCVTFEAPFGVDGNGAETVQGENDSVQECVGSFTGNYSGSLNGGVDGDLETDGRLYLYFNVEGDTMYADGQLATSGAIVGSSAGLIAIEGEMDLSDCTASGVWTSNYAGSGSWTVVPN